MTDGMEGTLSTISYKLFPEMNVSAIKMEMHEKKTTEDTGLT